MSAIVTGVEKRKVKFFLRKILEALHLRLNIYKLVIVPNQKIALNQLRIIVKNSKPIDKKITGKKIVFNSVDGRYMPHTYLEAGVAKALQIRGNEIKMLICGGAFCKMCAGHFTVKNPYNPWSCKNCINFSKDFYEIIGLPYSTYKDYLVDKEIIKIRDLVNSMSLKECENFVYKSVNVGFHAKTSVERYFVGSTPEKELYNYVLKCELINSLITTDVADKVVINEKPNILVTSHGCYSSWGTFSDYFINKGIRTCVWLTGYKKNTWIFDKHKLPEYFKTYYEVVRKKRALDQDEEKELNNFIIKRMKGEEGDTAFYEFSGQKNNLRKIFNIDKYKKNYFIFPNVPWDRSITFLAGKVAFEDVYKWVSYTIDSFKNQPDLQLIIKIHPAEVSTDRSEKTMLDYINEKYINLPKNINIIPPKTDISPYQLFPLIDVGIVCNGTIGLEMALNNIPVIVTGKVHYYQKGFTYDVSTKKEYSETLLSEISAKKYQQKLAKIYAYFYFIKSFVPKDFVYNNNFLDIGWRIKSFDDFIEGKYKHLDHVCNYILNNGIYQNW